jgi:uncharacterized protein (TIGR02001 family)
MQINLKAAILSVLLTAPAVSFAQEAEESNLSWNLGLTTDYVFRGQSQSNRDIAVQGGLDYSFGDSGLYAGLWTSNVDFGEFDGPTQELDMYIGYNTDIGESVNVDVMLTRYSYYGEKAGYGSIDYNELIAKVGLKNVATLTMGYTNDYSNSGEDAIYAAIGNSWEINNGYSIDASFGRSYFDDSEYNDWSVGVTKAVEIGEISLRYHDTNLDERASDSVVLSVKIGG